MKNHSYDLEERTTRFAVDIRVFVSSLPKNLQNGSDGRQLVRSSGSVGANYIEANESLSKKDFVMRLKISRKEAKESWYWLRIISACDPVLEASRRKLLQEAVELRKILTAIISKSTPV